MLPPRRPLRGERSAHHVRRDPAACFLRGAWRRLEYAERPVELGAFAPHPGAGPERDLGLVLVVPGSSLPSGRLRLGDGCRANHAARRPAFFVIAALQHLLASPPRCSGPARRISVHIICHRACFIPVPSFVRARRRLDALRIGHLVVVVQVQRIEQRRRARRSPCACFSTCKRNGPAAGSPRSEMAKSARALERSGGAASYMASVFMKDLYTLGMRAMRAFRCRRRAPRAGSVTRALHGGGAQRFEGGALLHRSASAAMCT